MSNLKNIRRDISRYLMIVFNFYALLTVIPVIYIHDENYFFQFLDVDLRIMLIVNIILFFNFIITHKSYPRNGTFNILLFFSIIILLYSVCWCLASLTVVTFKYEY